MFHRIVQRSAIAAVFACAIVAGTATESQAVLVDRGNLSSSMSEVAETILKDVRQDQCRRSGDCTYTDGMGHLRRIVLRDGVVSGGGTAIFSVSLKAGQATSLTLTGKNQADLQVQIMDDAGQLAAVTQRGATLPLEFSPVRTGTYTFKVINGGQIESYYSVFLDEPW